MVNTNTTLGKRSRSTTSASLKEGPRPVSRASTTSIQSFDHHGPPMDRRHSQLGHEHEIGGYSGHTTHHNLGELEAAIMHLNNVESQHAGNNMFMDPSLQTLVHATQDSMPLNSHNEHYPQARDSYVSLDGAQDFPHHDQQTSTQTAQEPDEKRKRGASSTATNDRELRELLIRNDTRTLKDVAAEVIATERTPKSERTKQLFAMLWLKAVCTKAKTSVPRNRVYSHYATRCGTERVVPLNPASFGKLVRVIFPGIQTRRLGVRGESKYHYVDLALIEGDPQDQSDMDRIMGGQSRKNSIHQRAQPSIVTNQMFSQFQRLPVDSATFPPQEQAIESPVHQPKTENQSQYRLFADPVSPWLNSTAPTSSMYPHKLKFQSPDQQVDENDTIELPNIHDYTPPKTDIDAANALVACYRTHCTSLIDCIRFCKEKQFFRLFTSFHGTLTVPVQKLFVHADIAPWIKECDWLMYQKMIRFVSALTLQVAPQVVTNFLGIISKGLHAHISKVFQGNPTHVLEAKLEPATLFAHLLHRMIRVNQTAHAAAACLMNDQTRETMWQDWVASVNPKRIMESELPGCGYEEVFRILTKDLQGLLQPINPPNPYGLGAFYQDDFSDFSSNPTLSTAVNESIIDRIAQFVGGLPARFPHASARTILSCSNAIGTAAIREITVEGRMSYGSWWIVKVFFDEMGLWLASLGGFLDHQPPGQRRSSSGLSSIDAGMEGTISNGGSETHNGSRYSSAGANFGANAGYMGAAEGGLPPGNDMNHRSFHTENNDLSMNGYEHDHDDSGIGMSLMEEGLDLKHPLSAQQQQHCGFASHNVNVS